jgi:hypothetical protein
MSATRIGGIVVLVAALIAVGVLFLAPSSAVRYAGQAAGTEVLVSLRLGAQPVPPQVTVDLGDGRKVIAARLK